MKANLLAFTLYLGMVLLLCSCDDDDMDGVMCNDPAAVNYTPDASSNTACTYPVSFNPPVLMAELPSVLNEISGLASLNDLLLGHTDRSNPARLYFFSEQDGTVQHTINVINAPNNDWEDFAQSDTHLYIGDTGNNEGDRTDLGIFRIPLNQILPGEVTQVSSDAHIRFRYPEQQQFGQLEHNFDCEALLHHNGFLYLFTKNRADRRTNLYRLPATPDVVHDAELLGGFEVGGRIGGADISADASTVALVGYRRSGNSFVWKLSNFVDPNNFLSGQKLQYVLGPYSQVGQVEGVRFINDTSLYISNERDDTANLPPRLYMLNNF